MRLNKYIAQNSEYSRRKADEIIDNGEVTVNNKPAVLGMDVTEKDSIKINGKELSGKTDFVYYALNKPVGVVSTTSDEKGRKTVTDLVPQQPKVYPVGRLDSDSGGLIILTNDGDLANKITHPSFAHEKEYEVVVNSKSTLGITNISEKLRKGIRIDKKLMKMDSVNIKPLNENRYLLKAVLHTGYNRQIRRMCDKMRLEVKNLKRVRIGRLKLSELKIEPGEYRAINKIDIL